jgi:hypothetical protein
MNGSRQKQGGDGLKPKEQNGLPVKMVKSICVIMPMNGSRQKQGGDGLKPAASNGLPVKMV